MEHYALHLPLSAIPAPAGMRAVVVRTDEAEDGSWSIVHDVLAVVGFQPSVVHHYASDEPRSVHPDPGSMERLGWHYRHQEARYAPIAVTRSGRLEPLDPDDPRWQLLPPETPSDRIDALARKLRDKEAVRQAVERRMEDQEQGDVESD